MSGKYDSVLKESKKYEEVRDDRPFLRRHLFGINFLAVLLILFISFGIYFFVILSPARIVSDDLLEFLDLFGSVTSKLSFDYDFEGAYHLSGDVDVQVDTNYSDQEVVSFLNGLQFDYDYMEEGDYQLLDINSDEYSLRYYADQKNGYFNYDDTFVSYALPVKYSFSSYEEFASVMSEVLISQFHDLEFHKSVLVSDGKLVVGITFSVSGEDINQFYASILKKLGRSDESFSGGKIVSDSSQYIVTIKEDLFCNDLIDMKIVINDQDYRGVVTYSDSVFEYSDDDHAYRFVMKYENEDFSFRVYEGDDMKYILSGKGDDDSYIYQYQVINVVDNLRLQVKKDSNQNEYILNINKENGDRYVYLSVTFLLNYDREVLISPELSSEDYLLYSEMDDSLKNEVDQYVFKIYRSFGDLFQFVL